MKFKSSFIILCILFISCQKDLELIKGCTDKNAINYNPSANINHDCIYDTLKIYQTTPYNLIIPEGFPDMFIPSDNPMTVEGVALGELLFHDPILSANNTQSCASCHISSNAFSDPNQFSVGIDGLSGFRNASTLTNVGWNNFLNWDGSAMTLEEQAFEPIRNHLEMNNTWSNVENDLNNDSTYLDLFRRAFNISYIDSNSVVKALAQYERTLISANSRYDKYIRQQLQLSPSELNGYVIFNSEKGDCFHCHGTNLFMNNDFNNNGLDIEPFLDLGLANITGNENDKGKFKTPTLRNIEYSAPYMHDGRFSTLEEVVEHYNNGGNYSTTIDPLMKNIGIGLQLTNQEKNDLIAFLKTLSDDDFLNR